MRQKAQPTLTTGTSKTRTKHPAILGRTPDSAVCRQGESALHRPGFANHA
jgi:hypothetical protein